MNLGMGRVGSYFVEEVAPGGAQGGTGQPGFADAGVGLVELVEPEVVVVPDGLHGVVAFEVGDLLSEVGLVVVESVGSGDAEFLTHEGHGNPGVGADGRVADKGLPGIQVVFLVMGNIVQKNEVLTVEFATVLDCLAVAAWAGCGLDGEEKVLVQDVEVTARTVGDRTTVERFGHEDEAPFPGPGHVDDVLPHLRGKPLSEIGPQPVDPGPLLDGRRLSVGESGLLEPVRHVGGEVFPGSPGQGGPSLTRVDESVLLVLVGVSFGRVVAPDEGRILPEVDVLDVVPFAEIVPVGSGCHLALVSGRGTVVPDSGEKAG